MYIVNIYLLKKNHISISSMNGSHVFITFKSDRNILSIDYGRDINKDITGRNKVSLLIHTSLLQIEIFLFKIKYLNGIIDICK